MHEKRERSKSVALGSTFLNMILFAVKGSIAVQIGSLGLLTDSVHTLTDSVSSIGVYLGLRLADKPPDEEHPYGHGRAEHVAVLLVGLLLVMTAVKFLSDGAVALMEESPMIDVSGTIVLIIAGTAVVKLAMWGWSYHVGSAEKTVSLVADAWHHLTDVFTTVLVIVGLWGASRGYLYLDSLVGIGIACFIFYVGVNYTRRSMNNLMGAAPTEGFFSEIKEKAESFDGVKEVHGINVHDYGRKLAISLHMQPEDSTTSVKAHEIAHALKEMLEEEFSAFVEVHQEPWEPPVEEITGLIQSLSEEMNEVNDIHKIKVMERKEGFFISMHLVLPRDTNVEKAHVVATEVERRIKKTIEEELRLKMDVQVHIEPCEEDCEHCSVEEHRYL